jgi:hypothetical protein
MIDLEEDVGLHGKEAPNMTKDASMLPLQPALG